MSLPLVQDVDTSRPPPTPIKAVEEPAPVAKTVLKDKGLEKYRCEPQHWEFSRAHVAYNNVMKQIKQSLQGSWSELNWSIEKCNILPTFRHSLPFHLSSRTYTETDSDLPLFPEDFQVAKYSIFKTVGRQGACDADSAGLDPFSHGSLSLFLSFFFPAKENCQTWCAVELQCCSAGEGCRYRVVRYWMEDFSDVRENF